MSCVVTIIGSYAHVCLLSPSPVNFDDNEPFLQFARELLDVPLAYSMFWSIQQIYATTKTFNMSILESVMGIYRIGKRTWALYLGYLILQNAIHLKLYTDIVIYQSRQIEVSSFCFVIWMRIVVQEGFGFGGIVYCVLYTQQMILAPLLYI